jgi:hypothetical protein
MVFECPDHPPPAPSGYTPLARVVAVLVRSVASNDTTVPDGEHFPRRPGAVCPSATTRPSGSQPTLRAGFPCPFNTLQLLPEHESASMTQAFEHKLVTSGSYTATRSTPDASVAFAYVNSVPRLQTYSNEPVGDSDVGRISRYKEPPGLLVAV